MFTDIVGYTALGQKDEPLSLALVEETKKLLRPIFVRHNGREVKMIGDAFLVEFANALEAVRCAYDIQRSSREFNISMPLEKRLKLRVGVHLGDVVESDGDIFGDAVNVASRIESLATEGGVCLTQQVYDQVQNKVELSFVSLGKKTLKNVATPLEVYGVVLPWEEKIQVKEQALDTRRIAVLPFVSLSPDPQDEFFADGLTEELIDRLCQVRELEVIARTSVMSYKKKEKKAGEIGKELRAGTLIEGSVRKAGNKIRVTAQLINSSTEGHLWSSRYDRNLEDIFAVQTDIAKHVGDALKIRILPKEKRQLEKRPTKSTEAYTHYLKGRQYWNKRGNEDLIKAIEYFTQAIEIDPEYALAYSGMADCYTVLGDQQHIPYREAFPRAKEFALRAAQLDDSSVEAHASLGTAISNMYDWDGGEREFKRALELNPNYATGHQGYGILLMRTGKLDDSLREALAAQQLDPLSPQITLFCGQVYERMGKYDLAEEQIKKVLHRPPYFSPLFSFFSDPNFLPGYLRLAWLYLRQGKFDEAESEVIEWLRLSNNHPLGRGYLAVVHAFKGDEEEARKIIDGLNRERVYSYVPNQPLIIAYLRLGDKEKAVELVQREFEDQANWLPEISFDPTYSSVTSDPRVVEILKKVGLGS